MYYYPRLLPNYMHTEPEREYAHQNELSVKTLTRPLKSVSQFIMPVAVMIGEGPMMRNRNTKNCISQMTFVPT